jgi:hypothetical protein
LHHYEAADGAGEDGQDQARAAADADDRPQGGSQTVPVESQLTHKLERRLRWFQPLNLQFDFLVSIQAFAFKQMCQLVPLHQGGVRHESLLLDAAGAGGEARD